MYADAIQTGGHWVIPHLEEDVCDPAWLEALARGECTFNFEKHVFSAGIANLPWLDNPSRDVEWHILLHKFYYAPALAWQWLRTGDVRWVHVFETLLDGWMRTVPVDFIANDVTARRVQNWAYAWAYLQQGNGCPLSAEFVERFTASVHDQVESVLANLAPARNHRTLELYSVFLASMAFAHLPSAARWQTIAATELEANLLSDFLPDGVHCELSSDYHCIVLRNAILFLWLARLNGVPVYEGVTARVELAAEYAMHLHRPDGLIPALSDADSRDYGKVLEAAAGYFGREDFRYVATRGVLGVAPAARLRAFEHGGYVIARSAWNAAEAFSAAGYLVLDAGGVGAGNHGHLDALSVEIYGGGRPLVVDPGRYTYDEPGRGQDGVAACGTVNWRARFRGTRAHNTVVVDDLDQACYGPVAGKPKWRISKPHPQVRLVAMDSAGGIDALHASCRSARYDAQHDRYIFCGEGQYWLIADVLDARSVHQYKQQFQLFESDTPKVTPGNAAVSVRTDSVEIMHVGAPGNVLIEPGFVAPTYGHKWAAPRVVFTRNDQNVVMLTLIQALAQTGEPSRRWDITGDLHDVVCLSDGALTWQWRASQRLLSCVSLHTQRSWHLRGSIDDVA